MFARNALALVALATTALAQIPGLPSCAQGCVTSFGNCNQVDVKCICSDTQLLSTLSCCVANQCDAAGQAAVISFADALCGGQGVNNLPTKATCAPGVSYTGTATAAASGSASSGSASGSTTSAPSSESSAASSAASSGSSSPARTSAASSAAASSAAATSSGSSSAGKTYPVEGMRLGMAILGFLAAL